MYKKIIKPTPFGPVVIIWDCFSNNPLILRILLSNPKFTSLIRSQELYPEVKNDSCMELELLADKFTGYFEGDEVDFDLNLVEMALCGEFQQKVLRAQYKVPRGTVTTYQSLGMQLGLNNGARAVGNALAKNPFPIIIPCHRSVRSDGTLGGYQGGVEMKRALLDLELVPCIKALQGFS